MGYLDYFLMGVIGICLSMLIFRNMSFDEKHMIKTIVYVCMCLFFLTFGIINMVLGILYYNSR